MKMDTWEKSIGLIESVYPIGVTARTEEEIAKGREILKEIEDDKKEKRLERQTTEAVKIMMPQSLGAAAMHQEPSLELILGRKPSASDGRVYQLEKDLKKTKENYFSTEDKNRKEERDKKIGEMEQQLKEAKKIVIDERRERLLNKSVTQQEIAGFEKMKEEESKKPTLGSLAGKTQEKKLEEEIIDLTDAFEEKLLPEPAEKKEKLLPEPEKELTKELTIEEQMKAAKSVAEKIDAERAKNLKTPADSYEKKWGKIPEWQQISLEETNDLLGEFDKNTEKKIGGKAEWVMEKARATGEWYKKQPLKYKLLLSGSLIATASASAAIGGTVGITIATAAFTGKLTQRTLGGLATFISAEGWLKKSAEKGGKERTQAEAIRHAVEAATLGMLVGSGYFAEGIKNISDATGLTNLVIDAYHYFLPTEDAEKIINSGRIPIANTAHLTPPEAPGIKLNISDNLNMPKPVAPHLNIDSHLPTTPVASSGIHLDTSAGPIMASAAHTAEIAGGATKEAVERGLTADFSVELGKNGVPGNLERVFHMMAANHMDLKGTAIFGEADGAKSLNMAANLVKLAEGHNLADVDNIHGISADDFKNAVTWDQAKGLLTIKDHNAFNKIVGNLESRSDTLWGQGVLKKGAVAYLNDIKPETWEKIIHADGLGKIGGVETGITGHDDILMGQIKDFNASEMVKGAENTTREAVLERMDKIRNELGLKLKNAETPTGKEYALNIPENPEITTLADDIMRKDVNELFGSKGFWGIGAKDGLDSSEWLKAKNISALKTGGKIREYINNLISQTGTNPKDGETAGYFIKRAIKEHLEKNNKSLGSSIKNLHDALKSSPVKIEIPKNNDTVWFSNSDNK